MSRIPQTEISAAQILANGVDGNNQTIPNALAEVRNGPAVPRGARVRGDIFPTGGLARLDTARMGFVYTTSRQGSYTNFMACIPFDTSNIKTPPAKAQITFGTVLTTNANNLASDHAFILCSIEGGQFSEAQVLDRSGTARSSFLRREAAARFPIVDSRVIERCSPNSPGSEIVFAGGGRGSPLIEGFVSGSSFAGNLRTYSEPQLVSSISPTATVTINLNREARLDIARSNHFFVSIIDYSYFVLNRDPAVVAPSAGAESAYFLSIANIGGTHNVPGGQITTFGPPQLTLIAGEIGRGEKEPKEKIDREFTINAFENITSQRIRFPREDGTVPDQVPFLLGTKGPLSLRGRQFTEDGIPISTTVKPPNTSKS